MAQAQGAAAWELRTATSWARFQHNQNRSSEAYELLAPVLDRFTDGFATADFLAACGAPVIKRIGAASGMPGTPSTRCSISPIVSPTVDGQALLIIGMSICWTALHSRSPFRQLLLR
jgi:hypothetical protein